MRLSPVCRVSLPFVCVGALFACVVLADNAPPFAGTKAGEVRDDNGLKTKLVWIPPGEFTMGSPQDEKDRYDDENQVQVTLTKGFWLGQHEVTQAEWQRLMQTTPWSGKERVKEATITRRPT
jgi:formylglycine-generating enzyme required for sulfatase activity